MWYTLLQCRYLLIGMDTANTILGMNRCGPTVLLMRDVVDESVMALLPALLGGVFDVPPNWVALRDSDFNFECVSSDSRHPLDTVILGSNIDHTPRRCRKRLKAVLSTFSHKSPCRLWHTYDPPRSLSRSYAPPTWCQPT